MDQETAMAITMQKGEEQRQYPAILTKYAWLINDFFYSIRTPFTPEKQWVIMSGEDTCSLILSQIYERCLGDPVFPPPPPPPLPLGKKIAQGRKADRASKKRATPLFKVWIHHYYIA